MAIDLLLIERIDRILDRRKVEKRTIKMMGGLCYMINDKMCFGTYKGGMMVRVDPQDIDKLSARDGAEQMLHGGRPMKSFMWIAPEGYDAEEDLEFWVDTCLEYNPKAKSSRKKN